MSLEPAPHGELERRLTRAITEAHRRGQPFLPEPESFDLARWLGLATPRMLFFGGSADVGSLELGTLPGERVVLKVSSPEIGHRTELGGVRVVVRSRQAVEEAVADLERRFAVDGAEGDGPRAAGIAFSVHELVEHDRGPGDELLLGVRWTDDFGPVAVVGLGGSEVERLATSAALAPLIACGAAGAGDGRRLGAGPALLELLTTAHRAQPAKLGRDDLEAIVARLLELGERWMGGGSERLSDFEINPAVLRHGELVALDALAKVGGPGESAAAPRPLAKLTSLLEPRSIAIAGVSHRRNVGRVILENVLRQGFDPERIFVIKPGVEALDGCRAYPDFEALPEPVDLAVLAVSAAQLPDLVEGIVAGRRAESLILIPGGLGEREGSETAAAGMAEILAASRATEWQGPVVNGANCLGIRSLPGSYDTLFIPGHKLSFPRGEPSPVAVLSQSGAFAVARASKLTTLDPKYVVTFGNQIDLTLGDYLTYLADDRDVRVFACYVEGFRPLDGRRFLAACRRITDSGRQLILYRAGRTRAGARAAASHTASVAGSYLVTRRLATTAGAVVAETIEDFDDLVRTFVLLEGRGTGGRRLAAMSNAGFESVAIGDNLGDLDLAELTTATRERIGALLTMAHLETIVAPRNPLDVTPILGDEAFAEAAGALLADPGVDVGLVGCVPLTPALETLAPGEGHGENVFSDRGVAARLIELWQSTEKPWVAVIDGGALYDPLARRLETAGLPTFRSIDRALHVLDRWVGARA